MTLDSYELYSKNKTKFQEEATKQLVGCIVLTRLFIIPKECYLSYEYYINSSDIIIEHTELMTLPGKRILGQLLSVVVVHLFLSWITTSNEI